MLKLSDFDKNHVTTDSFILFWNGIFSNFYPCKINTVLSHIEENFEFSSSEQLFMYYKAMFFDDIETANKILRANSPGMAKKLGREVKGYNELLWKTGRYRFMRRAVKEKFLQNQEYYDILKETGSKILVEASPYDKIWGIGLGNDSEHSLNPGMWQGENLLGYVLMDVRASI